MINLLGDFGEVWIRQDTTIAQRPRSEFQATPIPGKQMTLGENLCRLFIGLLQDLPQWFIAMRLTGIDTLRRGIRRT